MAKERSNSVITTQVDAHSRTITFNVKNAPGTGMLVLHLNNVHAANLDYAAFHGFKQRISDAAAIERNSETGLPASPGDKLAAMTALVEHYESGSPDWATRVARTASEGGLLLQSLMRMGVARETAAERIAQWSRSEQLAVLNSPKVKLHADAIRLEAGKGIEVSGLLEGLGI